MQVLVTKGWDNYSLLDSGDGRRLEQFGEYVLNRPDPQAIWMPSQLENMWEKADAVFLNDKWQTKPGFPEKWKIQYKNLTFWARLTPFKHTGIFPEQHIQWDWLSRVILSKAKDLGQDSSPSVQNDNGKPNVLNLFGYTGIASLAAAEAGASVTHVDASKPAITWTRENQELSGLLQKPIRWIVDDAVKFVERENKRGKKYDGIIMDPPAYGHGPDGKPWDFHKDMPTLLSLCKQILSDKPLFVLINAYAISSSAILLNNMLEDMMGSKGSIEYGELALQEPTRGRLLSTGIFARWSLGT